MNWKSEKQREDKKLSIYMNYSCSLHVEYLWYIRKLLKQIYSFLWCNMCYTTLLHNWIKDKLVDLIERTFQREGSPYLACNDRNSFFTSENPKKYHAWSCQNVCDVLTFLLDNIFIRFGTKLYSQVVVIPTGTICAPLVADLFLFCYERDLMMSLSND